MSKMTIVQTSGTMENHWHPVACCYKTKYWPGVKVRVTLILNSVILAITTLPTNILMTNFMFLLPTHQKNMWFPLRKSISPCQFAVWQKIRPWKKNLWPEQFMPSSLLTKMQQQIIILLIFILAQEPVLFYKSFTSIISESHLL